CPTIALDSPRQAPGTVKADSKKIVDLRFLQPQFSRTKKVRGRTRIVFTLEVNKPQVTLCKCEVGLNRRDLLVRSYCGPRIADLALKPAQFIPGAKILRIAPQCFL